MQLVFITGLTLLFLAVLMWGVAGVTPAWADPGTLYVDGATGSDDSDCSDPTDPCATIGYALTQARNGDDIRVAEGIYTETLDIAITVTLKGGYTMSGTLWLPRTGETIVDADGADASVFDIGPGNQVAVEGFTVQGANHTSGFGGGFSINGSTVVISGTVVSENSTDGWGGGVWVEGNTASISLINSALLDNTAGIHGGGLGTTGLVGPITVDNVEVRGNTAQGAGGGLSVFDVFLSASIGFRNDAQSARGDLSVGGMLIITNSRIMSNTAGGPGGGILAGVLSVYNSEISRNEANGTGTIFGGGISMRGRGPDGLLVIRDSTVSDNRAVGTEGSIGGGIDAEGAEATIVNTIVSNNSAQIRGGVGVYQTVLTVTNSLLISNTGDGLGGRYITGTIANVTSADNTGIGLFVGGAVSIINSIMWGNDELDYWCTGGCTLTFSDVEDEEITGIGNIFADPLFVDAVNGDYRLGVGSPCVDTGTPAGAPAADIEGTPRDAAPDMGAYEWTGYRIFLPLTLRNAGP